MILMIIVKIGSINWRKISNKERNRVILVVVRNGEMKIKVTKVKDKPKLMMNINWQCWIKDHLKST